MAIWPFSTDLVQFLFDHRTDSLLTIAKLASLLGDVEGYVAAVALVYVCFDKSLAFRLAVVALLAMTLDHVLKILIGNPRPFVVDGSFVEKWAVSPENLTELAAESSTPSGHAMSASAFYGYMAWSFRNRPLRIAAVLLVLVIGLSRPYIGVHFLEDVLLGWAIGLGFAVLAFRYGTALGHAWTSLGPVAQIIAVVMLSNTVYLGTLWTNGGATSRLPVLFLEYLGFLTGIVAARPLECRFVDFDPRSGSKVRKLVRWLITVLLIMVPILAFESTSGMLSFAYSPFDHLIRYAAFALAGLVGMFVAPLALIRLRLVARSARNVDGKS